MEKVVLGVGQADLARGTDNEKGEVVSCQWSVQKRMINAQ